MKFNEKLYLLRISMELSQEKLAEKLNVSRQSVAKWETGQCYPDIEKLIILSDIFKITIDKLVKEDDECSSSIIKVKISDEEKLIDFLIAGNSNGYANYGEKSISSRPNSIDYVYEEGSYKYIDSYVGSEIFAGEEGIWIDEIPVFAMNYSGRILADEFSGDFLKEALRNCTTKMPYRGPEIFKNGNYTYHCNVTGTINWFQGYEDIFYDNKKVYECYFHGGTLK